MESIKDGPGQTSDTRLIERAIRERWPIKPEWRAKIAKRLYGIATSSKASSREATSAARALISADKLNIDEAPPAQEVNVTLSGDLADALAEVAKLTPDQRAKLAEADRILSDVGGNESVGPTE